jgi:hypothetical protein
MVSGNR